MGNVRINPKTNMYPTIMKATIRIGNQTSETIRNRDGIEAKTEKSQRTKKR